VTIYLRTQKKSDTRKTYWGFEPVALSKGRKPAGSYYLRHVDLNGKQTWVPAGQSFTEADELKAKLSAEKTVHSSPREGHPIPHRCGSIPVHHIHQSLQSKMQSSESSGDNLRLLIIVSAHFSRALGRRITKVYSGRGGRHCYGIMWIVPIEPTSQFTLPSSTSINAVAVLTVQSSATRLTSSAMTYPVSPDFLFLKSHGPLCSQPYIWGFSTVCNIAHTRSPCSVPYRTCPSIDRRSLRLPQEAAFCSQGKGHE